jgi:hypothetical protein
MAERKLIKAMPADLLAQEYLGIITMAFDRHVLGNSDIDQGILDGCSEIARNVSAFYKEIKA